MASRDHPRACGEKNKELEGVWLPMESPPRGRGKAFSVLRRQFRFRITPAWAGKRQTATMPRTMTRDHPRVGGEKLWVCCYDVVPRGSPPRGRGKEIVDITEWPTNRITPAWAGKSNAAVLDTSSTEDHPRMGGEKCIESGEDVLVSGSPPHGRGKDVPFIGTLAVPGITPAWAGKRLKRSHRSGIFISGPIPFHSVLHRPAGSGGSRAGRDGSPAGQPQNAGPA